MGQEVHMVDNAEASNGWKTSNATGISGAPDLDDGRKNTETNCTEEAPTQLALSVVFDEEMLIGEWRQVENIITITMCAGTLTMIADATQPPLQLVWQHGNQWQAQKFRSGESVYDVSFSSKDTLEIRKGERAIKIFRVAHSKTLVGDWIHHDGKTLSVVDANGALEIRSNG